MAAFPRPFCPVHQVLALQLNHELLREAPSISVNTLHYTVSPSLLQCSVFIPKLTYHH
jgi:hypothetical protein